ncbi:hypothetical protein KDA82_10230, partial [Streptomyces daliensis]|nr:hypothetical protein [Streptomyces daliensis]
GAGAAQALPEPGGYMVGDTFTEPSKAACEKDGNSWSGVNQFSCLGPYADGTWKLRIDSISQCPGAKQLPGTVSQSDYAVKGC